MGGHFVSGASLHIDRVLPHSLIGLYCNNNCLHQCTPVTKFTAMEILGKCNTLVGQASAYTIGVHPGCMNTQCTCMFNCLCCIVSVRNLFDQLNINRVHGHTTVAIVNILFILGFFCSVFMDMYTMQLIIEVCLFAGDWSHWMHEYVHVALRQSEICFKSLIEYQQQSAWAYHSGHSTCKCII